MRYVVAYDISDNSRRERTAALLQAWGDRVQYSVFELEIDARELAVALQTIEPLIHPPADRLRVWRLCSACQHASHAIGGAALDDREVAWVI